MPLRKWHPLLSCIGLRIPLALVAVTGCMFASHPLFAVLALGSSLIELFAAVHPLLAVLARSLMELLPPIEVAAASWCNADPDRPEDWEVGSRMQQVQGMHCQCSAAVPRALHMLF